MPVPDDARTLPADSASPPQTAPQPIYTANVFTLSASPNRLETIAEAWRALKENAESAEEIVDLSTRRVMDDEAWTGRIADGFDDHQRRLHGDIGDLAAKAGSVALTLESLAEVLLFNQRLLDQERDSLAHVPSQVTFDGLVFHPENDEQAQAVEAAISAANEIRDHVDERLHRSLPAFAAAKHVFERLEEQWQPRTVRMLNLNVGSSHEVKPWDANQGMGSDEVDDLAALIDEQGADVVTIQEIFGEDTGTLRRQLEERTGDRWEIRFEEATSKRRYDGANPLDWSVDAPYGNAVLVRVDGPIDSVAEGSEEIELDTSEDAQGDEGRSATRVGIEFDQR